MIDICDIESALERIRPFIKETPVVSSENFQQLFTKSKSVHFKCENFQKTGSFKVRGAINSVIRLKETNPEVTSVVTRSCGNFGAGLGK